MLAASISGSITSFVGDHGVYAVFLLLALGAVFPAASELVMLYAGALASGAFAGQDVVLFGHQIDSDGWAFVTMALVGTIGYLAGSVAGWCIGRYGGRPFVKDHGRFMHVDERRLARAEHWFERRERWAVLIGCMTPVVRSFVAIPAGIFRMPLGLFVLLTAIGSAIWSFVFTGIGYAVGSNYERFHHFFDIALVAGAALVALYLVARVASSRLKSRRA
ncbi:MAG TPA: DedA family protein [Gaiellaceae bacterium]